jgi:RNA polymerase sigma factor (TIGR02999 family)
MPSDVTRLLSEWSRGNQGALRAKNYLRRERLDHTLQPTALIHEAYLRLVNENSSEWSGRAHFLAVASLVMRQILVDHARRHAAAKRGSGPDNTDLLALDEALSKLAAFDKRKCRIVEMRYFGGCTVEETAEALGVAGITVMREMRLAEAWLRRCMRGENSSQ